VSKLLLAALLCLSTQASAAALHCNQNGDVWAVRPPQLAVLDNPALGRHLRIDLRDLASAALPYLWVTAPWKQIDLHGKVTLHPDPRDAHALDAAWTNTPPGPLAPPNFLQPGVHFLERGALTVTRFNRSAATLSLTLDFHLREGDAQHPGPHAVDVRCTLTDLPVKLAP